MGMPTYIRILIHLYLFFQIVHRIKLRDGTANI